MKIIVALDANDNDLKVHEDVKEEEDIKEEEDLETSGRYSEEDADITIISSDRVLFKVHSFLLLRASSVFKSMINMAQVEIQRDPINLTDNHVEHSLVVHATLDIIYDHEVTSFENGRLYHQVIEFARKWDIPLVLKTISKEIRAHTHSAGMERNVMKHFRLALDLGEYDLITTIIRSNKGKTWATAAASGSIDSAESPFLPAKEFTMETPTLTGTTREWLKGAQAFDLGGWPYSSFVAMPSPLVWAMLRAQKTVDLSPKPHSSKAFPEELKKILDIMYPKQTGM